MRVGIDGAQHLGYCTNVHPAAGWRALRAELERHALGVKARLAPRRPMGLGLRLSAEDALELSDLATLREARAFLELNGLYVFAMNGFPYGRFHGAPVKAAAFAPDWRTDERLAYTVRLAEILAALLPDDMAEGGVSTCPLSYREWVGPGDRAAADAMAAAIADTVSRLVRLRDRTGKTIHLDLEPEPDGLLESSSDVVRFFERHLLPTGRPVLARALGISSGAAEALLRTHVRVCWDTCHLAIGYEAPLTVLHRFEAAGLAVGRLQVSSALRVRLPDGSLARRALAEQLARWAEPIWLHQVVERRADGTLARHPDLGPALAAIQRPDAVEWRIHFHVPLFAERLAGGLSTTAGDARAALELQAFRPFTRVVEVETYTWSVLPAGRRGALADMLAREIGWALAPLEGGRAAA